MTPLIDARERRARIAVRHHLAPGDRVGTVVEAACGVVCLHATDPATVYLSALARLAEPSIGAVDRALYEERSVVRMLAMRRTMFVVDVEEAPVLHAAASLRVARELRRQNEGLAARLGVEHPARWLRDLEADTLAALAARGEATAQQLSRDVPELARKVRVSVGKTYEGDIGISSRVLLGLAAEGRIVRGRPLGTWLSSQYRWTPMEAWLGHPLPEVPVHEAQSRLIGRWLARFGPGTEADLRWWTGLTAREVRAAIASLAVVEVDLDGVTGYLLPDDLEPTPAPDPWVALLPALDPTTMGWQSRAWYLGEHAPRLFDRNGNAGPTIWCDGRIVGGWAIREGGEVVTRLLEDVGREAEVALEVEAGRLVALLGSVRVVPRFTSPLHREMLA